MADNNQALIDLNASNAALGTALGVVAAALTDLAAKATAGQDISAGVEAVAANVSTIAAQLTSDAVTADPPPTSAPAKA